MKNEIFENELSMVNGGAESKVYESPRVIDEIGHKPSREQNKRANETLGKRWDDRWSDGGYFGKR